VSWLPFRLPLLTGRSPVRRRRWGICSSAGLPCRRPVGRRAVRQTRSVLRCQLLPHVGDVRVGDLTAERIDELYAELGVRGGQRGQPLAPGTIKRVHVVLHSALAQAMRWGWIWDNTADRAHRITPVAREPEPPTVDELNRLLDEVRAADPAFHLLLVLAATTGPRRAQLLGLRWRDVDLDNLKVSFCGGWVEGEHGPVLTATKNKRRYAVDIDDATAALLAEHVARFDGGRDSFLFAKDADERIAWKPNWVTKTFLRPSCWCSSIGSSSRMCLFVGVPLNLV
jgi:integrase